MKFSGKELFDLGVPQNKIKLFINREFSSKEEIFEELKPKESKNEKVFTWIDWLWDRFGPTQLPMKFNGEKPERMSKSELRRIFDSKSIVINGKNFKSTDVCLDDEFPIQTFVWFPKSKKSKVTWM